MTLTDGPEVFVLDLQTLARPLALSVLLVAASLVLLVLLVAGFFFVAALLITAELLVEVVGQGPLKGSVSGCVPFMTSFPVIGSAKMFGLFAGSCA